MIVDQTTTRSVLSPPPRTSLANTVGRQRICVTVSMFSKRCFAQVQRQRRSVAPANRSVEMKGAGLGALRRSPFAFTCLGGGTLWDCPPQGCKARTCRLGDALPPEPHGLSVKLTPLAGNEWDDEARRLAERTTLDLWQANPMCHWLRVLSDFRHAPRPTLRQSATQSQHATRAPTAVGPEVSCSVQRPFGDMLGCTMQPPWPSDLDGSCVIEIASS